MNHNITDLSFKTGIQLQFLSFRTGIDAKKTAFFGMFLKQFYSIGYITR